LWWGWARLTPKQCYPPPPARAFCTLAASSSAPQTTARCCRLCRRPPLLFSTPHPQASGLKAHGLKAHAHPLRTQDEPRPARLGQLGAAAGGRGGRGLCGQRCGWCCWGGGRTAAACGCLQPRGRVPGGGGTQLLLHAQGGVLLRLLHWALCFPCPRPSGSLPGLPCEQVSGKAW